MRRLLILLIAAAALVLPVTASSIEDVSPEQMEQWAVEAMGGG